MSFEDILNQWESGNKSTPNKKKSKPKKKSVNMDSFLDMYPPDDDSDKALIEPLTPRQKRRNYRRMKPQRIVDLHGFTLLAAEIEFDDFIKRCRKKKIEKILIIHGKGLHSEDGEAVLRKWIIDRLKDNPHIGEIGHPSEKEGGAGATWAILKY